MSNNFENELNKFYSERLKKKNEMGRSQTMNKRNEKKSNAIIYLMRLYAIIYLMRLYAIIYLTKLWYRKIKVKHCIPQFNECHCIHYKI